MILTVIAVSAAAYLFSLFKFRGKWVQQQIAFLIIYLIGLTIIGELDILLPIYFVVSLLPFVPRLRKISMFTGFLGIYFLIYLVYGLMNQDISGTLVTFIAKMWQFMVFFIVYDASIDMQETDYRATIRWALLVETLLGLYLIFTSTNMDANGLVRLVSNAQPITGNLSTVALPISAFYYMKNRANPKATRWLLMVNIVMLVWIVLSGTRGYTLEFAFTMVLIAYDYYTNGKVGQATQRIRIFTALALGAAALLIAVVIPGVLERFSSILRLKSSVGIRTYENAAIKEFMANSPILTVIFGIGLGGTGGSYSAMSAALSRQFSLGMWDRYHYMNDSGALFHNLYANVLMCLGILGAAVIIWLNVQMWKRITKACGNQVLMRRVMHLFQLSFLWMNYYRWSAVCGIAEMIVFALILKAMEQNNLKRSVSRRLEKYQQKRTEQEIRNA